MSVEQGGVEARIVGGDEVVVVEVVVEVRGGVG